MNSTRVADSRDTDTAAPEFPRGVSRFGGALGSLVLVWLSLTPSLLPRGPLFQGVVTGAAAAFGYGLGLAIAALLRWMLHREPRPTRTVVRWGWAIVAALGTVTVLIWYAEWQSELRALMGVSGLAWHAYPIIVAIGGIVFVVLVAVSKWCSALARWVGGLLERVLPPRVAAVLGGVVVAVLAVAAINGVVAQVAMSVLNETFKAVDQQDSPDTEAPVTPERSGGPGSLVTWESLGRQGRIFVANGPTAQDLTVFSGEPARDPIRVYTGLDSAENIRAEADLAVAELRRAGGFERAVLGVATTTGTGWINESTASALEYLANGDSALVSMQYSYLPSWLSFLVDQERARQAGQALFEAVHAEWDTLPADRRPKLVVFGESLGSFGGEAAFAGIQDMAARTDGVLFVGPTATNPVWRDATARRDPGSPQWLPIYRDGHTVRFVADAPDLARPDAAWGSPKVVYLQHASDPITWWTPQLLFQKPDWLSEERGPDVLASTRWIPVVTFLQVSADMAVSTDVPDGHGHTFHADIADAWAAILAPAGWTPADTERLRAILRGTE
ncbi:alpha/beta hydrolase [Nocardia neocaledoniensis]|uniref:alpha/beta hydrolase n=1 Tax=Nocardia neocaledoniensis TaxID=236511 RepID=UPI002454B0A2|nr:alpha/beta-hydrolase family protein [Nocardia neocaledoniensis]